MTPSFEEFYAAHYTRLTVQVGAYLGDLVEAQDVVQEAFSRAWPRWESISRYEEPAAWIRRVAWNEASGLERFLRLGKWGLGQEDAGPREREGEAGGRKQPAGSRK